MAVYEVEQTNPLHYTLQVMYATGLVCSYSAANNVPLRRQLFSFYSIVLQQAIMSIACFM